MKIQYVSISPTTTAQNSGCYSLTPELLAATGARYSRNNEGLDSIVSKIDFSNTDKSVDGIFKMVDFGHASIADMAPIALFIDDISLFAAYFLWTLAPTAGGQECSTRYIKMDSKNVVDDDSLGIPHDLKLQYWQHVEKSFKSYELALEYWTEIGNANPELTKIPSSLYNSSSDKDKKQVARMMRNFAFDRARVYLPVSAMTGVMMIQSARAWANMSAHLQSNSLRELNLIGKEIEEKLKIGAPRLVKHCKPTDAIKDFYSYENSFEKNYCKMKNKFLPSSNQCDTNLKIHSNKKLDLKALSFRKNRYSPFGHTISQIPVTFSWEGITFGEIRDLNRHRTGSKYCSLVPIGFYGALDENPKEESSVTQNIQQLFNDFEKSSVKARELMKEHSEYIYFTNLGHKYYFEHTTTADKFIYEMELRTGVGAHYKYAEHCRKALELWYKKYPESKALLFEGSAEPE
jgi:thymidylate synthase ThyX